MRLLVVSDLFPPEVEGGYEMNCASFVSSAREAGHEVNVLSISGGVLSRVDYSQPYFSKHRCDVHNFDVTRERILSTSPDLMVSFGLRHTGLAPLAAATALGTPIVLDVQDIWLANELRRRRSAKGRLKDITKSLLLNQWTTAFSPSLVIATSGPLSGQVRKSLSVTSSAVVAPGVGDEFLDTPVVLEPPGPLQLLFCGRLNEQKRPDWAIRALAYCVHKGENAYLTCAGRGDAQRLKNLALDLGVEHRVRFVGWLSDPLTAYDQCNILLFPSMRYEAFGLTAAEACARGRAVVATRCGGPESWYTDGRDALLVDEDDLGRFCRETHRLASMNSLRKAIARGARELALREFRQSTNNAQKLELVENALAESKGFAA